VARNSISCCFSSGGSVSAAASISSSLLTGVNYHAMSNVTTFELAVQYRTGVRQNSSRVLPFGTKRPWVGKEKTPSPPRMPADAAELARKKHFNFCRFPARMGRRRVLSHALTHDC
jgi:hypothetical protein